MGSNNTIKIADTEVSMEDIFKRPEMIKALKKYEEVLKQILNQITDIRRCGRVPEILVLDPDTFNLVRQYGGDRYWPAHKQQRYDGNDRFMNLVVAVTTGYSDNSYIKVA